MKKNILKLSVSIASLTLLVFPALAETINIATVNNRDMIIMKELSSEWQQKTGNQINWIVLEENALRERVTTDIATQGGQFDVITIGNYEAPIFAKNDWLATVDDLGEDYDYADIIKPVRDGLTLNNHLYAVPFYAETSFTFYRKDLFQAAGLTMPEDPTYDQIKIFAEKLTNKSKQQYGICLRGKPGYGENMSFLNTMINAYGGRWFDADWKPQINTAPWKAAVTDYVDMVKNYGPAGSNANGFNEALTLFATGRCAMWIDATSAAGRLYDTNQSIVANKVDVTRAPKAVTATGSSWLYVWSLALPKAGTKSDTAKSFIKWATSKEYIERVAQKYGWVSAPPGTRQSTYANAEYQKAAPFAATVLNAIQSTDPNKPTLDPVPYTGIQFVAIPEYQSIGTFVGQQISAVLAGQTSVDNALSITQRQVERDMMRAGYSK